MTDEKRYHHGDLRAALLDAAEAELAERGVEGFSLRQVARRAGVSHAAPAHHFTDAKGLLTALAAEGFHRFLAAQASREARAAPDPRAQLLAAGLGYVDFALARPALFRLMFGSDRADFSNPDLDAASDAAYGHLMAQVAAIGGNQTDAAAVWSCAHGLADLLSAGRLKPLGGLSAEARDLALSAILTRSFPAPAG
ncbi:TetR/AcrR family transcriptional regulator [Paragemmobacter straminiformis]|nr:TetR/AcrR family transcriptional regulator [Gemmobacter straminiformis]